jgi:Ca2+-binding EF-hand superfamily protein
MRQMNMTLTDGELRMLFEFYDEDNCGLIDHEQFVQGVRDPLTGSRLSLVHDAFNLHCMTLQGILM